MSIKDRLRRLEARLDNIFSGLELTDADLSKLEDRVADLERGDSDERVRDRIAEIIYRELEYDGDDFCGHVADVLVRELVWTADE